MPRDDDPWSKTRVGLPGAAVILGGGPGCGEGLEDTALRVLHDETGLWRAGLLEQLKTYGGTSRNRKGRTFSTAFIATIAAWPANKALGKAELVPVGGPHGAEQRPLVFDHAEILSDGIERLRERAEDDGATVASLLQQPFTIPELRRAYEVVWGCPLHRRNFQRKVLSSKGFLERTGKQRIGTGGPQADLYKTGKVTRLHPEMLRGSLLLDTGPARRLSSI